MLSALILAATAATASPQATSGAMRTFSGGNVQPIHGTSNPLLRKAAPQPNPNATAGPLLRSAAPGASANPGALRTFSGAAASTNEAPGINNNQGGRWGWAGLFGVLGLMGLWRRYSGM